MASHVVLFSTPLSLFSPGFLSIVRQPNKSILRQIKPWRYLTADRMHNVRAFVGLNIAVQTLEQTH